MESGVLLTEQAGVGLIGSEVDDLMQPLLKKTDRGGLGDRGFCGRSVVVKPPLDFLCTSCQQDRVMQKERIYSLHTLPNTGWIPSQERRGGTHLLLS